MIVSGAISRFRRFAVEPLFGVSPADAASIGAKGEKWRREMMRAIREAAEPDFLFKGSSLANGLRVIRTFERVNGRAFDPFNSYHRSLVRGMGSHEALFRKLWRTEA